MSYSQSFSYEEISEKIKKFEQNYNQLCQMLIKIEISAAKTVPKKIDKMYKSLTKDLLKDYLGHMRRFITTDFIRQDIEKHIAPTQYVYSSISVDDATKNLIEQFRTNFIVDNALPHYAGKMGRFNLNKQAIPLPGYIEQEFLVPYIPKLQKSKVL